MEVVIEVPHIKSIIVTFVLQLFRVAKFVKSYVPYEIKPKIAPRSRVLLNDFASMPGITASMIIATINRE